MNIGLIRVVAEWAVDGMAASYSGQKTFTMNVFEGEDESVINDAAQERAQQLVATEGGWKPGDIRVVGLSWECA